jgi:predicted AAA+ superfamily ATPase
MDIEELKRIISDQKEEIKEISKKKRLIERDVPKERLVKSLYHPNILAILGVRRCGKSILSHMLLDVQKYGYINFDDERIYGIEAKDLNKILQAFYEIYGSDLEYLILDEIQNVPGWELFANRLRRTNRVILTGSNAKLLSGELATHLTGRYLDFTLYPFSFNEILKFKELNPDIYSTKGIAEIKNALKEYIKIGGFPEAQILGREIVSRIYEDIIYKDIISRYGIRNKKSFSEIAKYLISNFSGEFTFRKLKNVTTIKNVRTVKNYVGYLESSYLLLVIQRFSFKLKEQMMAPRKVYCIDTGIINSIAFKFSEDSGKMMENLVAIELDRRKSYFGAEDVYYWKDHLQREVDFVLKEKEGEAIKELIQVSYASSEDDIKEREIKALLKASEDLRCKNMTIITWDYEGEISKIKCLPLWKWLLPAK